MPPSQNVEAEAGLSLRRASWIGVTDVTGGWLLGQDLNLRHP